MKTLLKYLSSNIDGLDGQSSIPVRGKRILPASYRADGFSGLNPTLHAMSSEHPYPGVVKPQGRETVRSTSSSSEVMKGGVIPSLLHMFPQRGA